MQPRPDLDPYRNRAGQLTRLDEGQPAGHLYVEIEQVTSKVGGLLWWRRWAAWQESLIVHLQIGDELDDFSIWDEHIDDAIDEWRAGRFHWCGQYAVEWLDDAETARVRTEFGFPGDPG